MIDPVPRSRRRAPVAAPSLAESAFIDDELLSLPAAAKRVGVSVRTLRRMVALEEITVIRPSPGRVVIPKTALADFLARRTVPARMSGDWRRREGRH